jgi:carboxypeptidase family protein
VSVKRIFAFFAVCVVLALCEPIGRSQSDTATITGRVLDPTNATVASAIITVLNVETQIIFKASTNEQGLFTVSGLPPGNYRIEAAKLGFKTVIKPDVVLHLQDVVAINFNMVLGSASESVTVEGGTPILDITDGSVSTVVDRSYVENMPLNGRSFQSLILLTPGVVTNSPQKAVFGEFSVNGQRTDANYYTVDGVSANIGIYAGVVQDPSLSGSAPSSTALGTTQSLVSVDALQEFRVQSSTYSAEYGRNPGGQFSFVTRPGVNQWHGSAFDYLRNNFFDANSWFNDYYGLPQAALRQNDFGGTVGGPVNIPAVYNGKDKSFFFFSYEGLRLLQPQEATVSQVPSIALRQSAPSALQPVLNAFPQPSCPTLGANCSTDLGGGAGDFVASWSNPSAIDSYSIRLDQAVSQRVRLFFRFGQTKSAASYRVPTSPSDNSVRGYTTRTYTVGATAPLSTRLNNETRFNYSSNYTQEAEEPDSFGTARATDLFQLSGLGTETYSPSISTTLFLGSYVAQLSQIRESSEQKQWNVVDNVILSVGRHQLKVGVDYRRLSPQILLPDPQVSYYYFDQGAVNQNNVSLGFAAAQAPAFPIYENLSIFAQDEWLLTPRLSLSFGLRWEVNPAPGTSRGPLPYTVEGNSLSALTLAPQGTQLWQTSYHNFAPRLGAAYIIRDKQGYETVARGGVGLFYDTAQQAGSFGYLGAGFSSSVHFGTLFGSPASFPLPPAQATPAITRPPTPPYSFVDAFPSHLQLPYTFEWNASIEQSLGKDQALTLSYVGAAGRKLLELNQVFVTPSNPNFGFVDFLQNGLTSNYNALQAKFQRTLSHGLQVLASYTWSHSIDYGSFNFVQSYQRGNSDFDVRHNLSSALMYDLPNPFRNAFAGAVLHHWGIDTRFSARTGFPVTLNGDASANPATGQWSYGGLDLVPGQPLYLYGSQYPGDRSINPAAFSSPPSGEAGDAPRNFVRGFGALQTDLAVRREFAIREGLKLQFRAEAFNVFNHPQFGRINSEYCPPGPGCTFGQATQTLAGSTIGNLSPLYQTGGPRSMQFALKFHF